MVLLTHGRISFDEFLCLPDPFWVLTLLVTEFVVSPTHDYATFSLYGSDVYIEGSRIQWEKRFDSGPIERSVFPRGFKLSPVYTSKFAVM